MIMRYRRRMMGARREKKLKYVGTATPLSVARDGLAATSVGDYALFGGGSTDGSSRSATVDVYQYK
jgi:hypothetical protein